jgi:hypothetical protein
MILVPLIDLKSLGRSLQQVVQGFQIGGTSVPNPKFAILRSALRANFGLDKDTSKFMILVSFMDQKFARRTRGNDGANF